MCQAQPENPYKIRILYFHISPPYVAKLLRIFDIFLYTREIVQKSWDCFEEYILENYELLQGDKSLEKRLEVVVPDLFKS